MQRASIPLGQIGDYEIKQLKVFKTVADCGGFSAAETELNISRSTISIHISNLESRLNLILCRRGRAGFALTEEGVVVYDATVKLLGELEDFRSTINHLDIQLSGSLTILFSDTISLDPRANIPKVINKFVNLASEVYLTAEVARMTEIERQVMSEEADIGFIPHHRFLDGSPTVYAGMKTQENIIGHLANMNLKATAYNYESRLALILSSKYIGYLPETLAQPYVESGALKAISPQSRFYALEIMAITKKTVSINKIRSLFIKLVREFYQKRKINE
jgi:DNA-binding transcriptional LysR family regulator